MSGSGCGSSGRCVGWGENVLEAAGRLADHLLTQIPSGKSIVEAGLYRGMPPSSILEPMVALYDRTGDKRYLDFAEYIVAQWETERGPRLIGKALEGVPVSQRFVPDTKQEAWWSWDNGQKACEMMSCYDGLLDLYKITGKPEYLEAVHKSVRNILDEEIDIAGSGRATTCLEDVGLAIRFAAWIFFARLFVSIYRKRRVPRRAPDKPVQRQDGGFGNGSRPMAWRLSGSEPSPERSGRSRVGGTLSRRKSKGILSTHAPDVVS
ncbi:beta-L-arabinofuranosidase domain-containing protein [uncultured Alistipes sp.]|uniref:beta-L-arabinofuranosidase domain-containing protein n=1 Tax=uncultured Alistipes sp. TaxID=538949 RepID=UPI002605008E|nr:beta-L-arabinofuranosidase domain-containing protein [uncultured Alistipes sp.]